MASIRSLIPQFAKFAVVGIIAFIIDLGLMVALVELTGMDPVVAATISFIVSVVFNYVASMRYVFSHRDDISRTHEFVVFVILSVIGLAINDLLMWIGTTYTSIDYRIVKIVATAIVTLYNFFSRRRFLDGGARSARSD